MAVRHDYLAKLETTHVETSYVDLVLEGWAKWSRDDGGPPRPAPAGELLRIASIREGRYELTLAHDEFCMVDKCIALLVERLREIVELEYRGMWLGRRHLLSQEQKWQRIGLRRTPYKERLSAAQWTIYDRLMPHVDVWRIRNL